ncbi:hypothetical protein [Nocardia cyriacigeorgica]|uniref:hypothetical protein n=1 Tax=Nocardia cyriacigeorgica TaxID=135487 RepID=UPI00189478E8|nr:hypothetical protein [Nocardia cyriacigeorgica]MBF6087644.1 hypothetical protein [Nocardia cyriacigeorgica]MBF6092425.1 hypothetical protein [Nocardia cyriacigeorgica]
MTNQNPPGSGGPEPQWWETPSTGQGADPSRADPTILRSDLNQPVADPTILRSDLNPPGDPYGSGANPYASGATPYPGANPYPSGANPYPPGPQQQWAPGQPVPPVGFMPPPPRPSNKTPWIIGGSIAAVVLLVVIGGVIAIASSVSDSGGDEPWEGDYAFKEGNACELVDLSVLEQWAVNREETTHKEDGPMDRIGGGDLSCRAKNTNPGEDGGDASLSLEVAFDTKYQDEPRFDMWKQFDTGTTGTGYDHGTVSDIGERGYYATQEHTYSYIPSTLDHVVAVNDSNISVKVEISVSSMSSFDRDGIDAAARAQVKKVLDALRK